MKKIHSQIIFFFLPFHLIYLLPLLILLEFPLLACGISTTSFTDPTTTTTSRHHHDRSFRLVSWNLLAPIYSPPSKYTWCDPLHLAWSYREPLIIERLRSTKADVVCLQEVQIDLWNNGFQQILQQELHYSTTLLQNVTNQHPVATAILIHQDCDLQLRRAESRSRALLAVLEYKPSLSSSSNSAATSSSSFSSSSYQLFTWPMFIWMLVLVQNMMRLDFIS